MILRNKEEAIIDGFISNKRKPSQEKLYFLQQRFREGLSLVSQCIGKDISDGNACEEFDLPRGSYWIQLIACQLDLKAPLTEEMPCLAELTSQLIYFAHLQA